MDEVGRLLAVDPDGLSHDARLSHLQALQALAARVGARTTRTLAFIEVDPPSMPTREASRARQWVREEVAALLRLAPATAGARLKAAADLVDRFPTTLDAVESGTLSPLHARVLQELTGSVSREVAAKVEDRVLVRGASQTIGEFRASVKRAVLSFDTRQAAEKAKQAAAQRRMWMRPDEDGMAFVGVYAPAFDAASIMAAVQARADRTKIANQRNGVDGQLPGVGRWDGRSADQRRVDALVDICLGDLHRNTTTQQGRRPAVQVTVAASTLAGLDCQPGELLGYGPIPADLALAIAFDPTGTWRRMVLDPQGRVIDSSTTAYRPPADLRQFVLDRDLTCRGIGCRRPAQRCELNHVDDWAHTHDTSAANLQPQCPRDHHLEHDGGWNVQRHLDGTVTWTTPTGRHYTKPPDHLPVDTTADTEPMPSTRNSKRPDPPLEFNPDPPRPKPPRPTYPPNAPPPF